MLTAPLSAIAGLYGTLSGKVTDDKGKPVVGATVRVQGTTRGAFVKADGKYIVVNIPAGTYTVVFKAVNFKDFKATVSISADQTTELNARMQESTVTSNAVVVDAKKEQNMVSNTQIGSLRSNQVWMVWKYPIVSAVVSVQVEQHIHRQYQTLLLKKYRF